MDSDEDNDILREVFRQQRSQVLDAASKPTVRDKLLASYIITESDNAELSRMADKEEAGRSLLDKLSSCKHPKAFVVLLKELKARKEYEWLVKIIRDEYDKKIDEKRTRPIEQQQQVNHNYVNQNAENVDARRSMTYVNDEQLNRQLAQSTDVQPVMMGIQVIGIPYLQQLIEQLTKASVAQQYANAAAAVRPTSSTLAEYVQINPDESHVYETLVGQTKEKVSEGIDSVLKWLDDFAQISRDAQCNVALMSIQSSKSKKGEQVTYRRLAEGNPVRALACVGTTLFVVRDKIMDVDCFELKTGQLLDKIAVDGLKDPRDMAACSHHQIIYIRDETEQTIHWVTVNGDKQSRWPIGAKAAGIAVNSRNELLIVCPELKTIKIMTRDGVELPGINLTPADSFTNVNHAVELCTDRIVVSCGTVGNTNGKVCVVNGRTGMMMYEYSGRRNAKQTFFPVRLAVCGYVFVADYKNESVLRLRPNLDGSDVVKVIATGTCLPTRICVDDSGSSIYVIDNTRDSSGNCTKGCVLVVPLV